MPDRLAKVNALLVTEVGQALERNITIPGVLATVTEAEVSADLKHATVWVSLLPDSEAAWAEVEASQPSLQSHIAGRLTLKHTPKLKIARDTGPAHAAKIDRLLRDR